MPAKLAAYNADTDTYDLAKGIRNNARAMHLRWFGDPSASSEEEDAGMPEEVSPCSPRAGTPAAAGPPAFPETPKGILRKRDKGSTGETLNSTASEVVLLDEQEPPGATGFTSKERDGIKKGSDEGRVRQKGQKYQRKLDSSAWRLGEAL